MENGKKAPLKKSLDYEKIEGLIRRGDCRTAEALIKKRPLSPPEREALSALMEERQKNQATERDRAWRRRSVYDRLEKFSWRSWKWFLGIFLLLGLITYPYNALTESAPRSALMEVLNGLACLDAAAFLVLRVLILCLAPPSRRDEYLKRDLLWWLLAALGLAAVFFFFAVRLKTGG